LISSESEPLILLFLPAGNLLRKAGGAEGDDMDGQDDLAIAMPYQVRSCEAIAMPYQVGSCA
jgi:hypothetical protein